MARELIFFHPTGIGDDIRNRTIINLISSLDSLKKFTFEIHRTRSESLLISKRKFPILHPRRLKKCLKPPQSKEIGRMNNIPVKGNSYCHLSRYYKPHLNEKIH